MNVREVSLASANGEQGENDVRDKHTETAIDLVRLDPVGRV